MFKLLHKTTPKTKEKKMTERKISFMMNDP